jgi:YjjG family noncanonical pyrimidine nucleotidase
MANKKYTHLFFDLDNTIWDFNSNSYDALKVALNKLELLEFVGIYDIFFKIYCEVNERLWDLYRQGSMKKKVLCVQRFEESFERNGTPLIISGAIVNDFYLAEMPMQTKLIDGARELLDYLHGRYDVAIITNGFKEVQYDKIQRSELSKYFRKIFISEEIGAQKPGRQIFEYAVKSMNAPKKSSLMIGDSWEADIIGAKNYGIDQLYFSPNLELPDSEVHFQGSVSKRNEFIKVPPYFIDKNPLKINLSRTSTTIITHLEQIFKIL